MIKTFSIKTDNENIPELWDIIKLFKGVVCFRCAVLDEDILNGMWDFETVDVDFDGNYDKFGDYVIENTNVIEKDFVYVWNENLCPEYLKYLTLDWLSCFLFTERAENIDENNWVLSYDCIDGAIVEISSPCKKIIDTIKEKYIAKDVRMSKDVKNFYKEKVVPLFHSEVPSV